jgi:DNA ligase-associated metallophosphoesterase
MMTHRYSYDSTAGPIILDAMKVAFLPQSKTLLVADLHFEKGSYLRMVGNSVLPTYDTAETIERLMKAAEIYAPRHLIALGDSFHDIHAGERLALADADALNRLVNSVPEFTWILGNHDPDVPTVIEGLREDHVQIDGFLLTHLPTEAKAGDVNICGHLHPKAKLNVRRRHITHPCFACSDNRIILPSFGAYTGGLEISHPAIQSELGPNKIYALTAASGIYPIKL